MERLQRLGGGVPGDRAELLLEALASGLPIAAYPTPGPLDVVGNSGTGVLDADHPETRKRMNTPLVNWRGITTGSIRPAPGLVA